jgi:hypothetical protein
VALIRTGLPTALIYLAYLIAYPEWGGRLYTVLVPLALAGGVVGLWFLLKILDLGAKRFAVELGFLVLVFLLVGYTLPQKSGKAPLEQWSAGGRPGEPAARRGVARLGLSPDEGYGAWIVSFFPR